MCFLTLLKSHFVSLTALSGKTNMGKAARWLKSLLGMKKEKDKDHVENSNSDSISSFSDTKKEKKRFSFGKPGPGRDSTSSVNPQIPARDMAWLRSYIADTDKEQNKHAIAVAAATAAAADAAVAAAQAAVAVVRLTSNGNRAVFGGVREKWAAVKIQNVFRGFLVSRFLFFIHLIAIF